MTYQPWVLALLIIVLVVFVYFVVVWVIRAHKKKIEAGSEELVGRTAEVVVKLNPKGVVLVEGERWNATVDKGWVEPEEEVVIKKVDGLRLIVTKK
ncbi:MAG: NfeD family protein [Dehalococcoidales bacterium]|nr:NfeD family protein [Dehalococcoidales bacterium]